MPTLETATPACERDPRLKTVGQRSTHLSLRLVLSAYFAAERRAASSAICLV